MAIRPPRRTRPRRQSRWTRDIAAIGGVSLVVVLFGLRAMLGLTGVDTSTIAWRVVAAPTGLLINPLERLDMMSRTPVANLTVATLVVALLVGVGALVALGTLANRRG